MEIFLLMILCVYFFVKHTADKAAAAEKEAFERERSRKHSEIHDRYAGTAELNRELMAMKNSPDREWYKGLVRENLNAILGANKYLTERDTDRYVDALVAAKHGVVFMLYHEIDLSGDKYTRAEKIEFAHQIELLMCEAGYPEFNYWYTPGVGVDLYDEDKMYKGMLVLREKHRLYFKDAKYRRLWD